MNAETDFASNSDKFQEFINDVADAVAEGNPADLDALLHSKYPGTDKTIEEILPEKILVIGENIKIRRFARYDTGVTVPYIHMGGRIGVLVNMTVEGIEAALRGLLEKLDAKPKFVFQPIRVAVCGNMVSPPLFESIELLDRDVVEQRLKTAAELAVD